MTDYLQKSYQYCSYIARTQAKNFYYSFLVLPKEKRDAMCAIYTFMRYCDDAVDDAKELDDKKQALIQCKSELDLALRGQYRDHPLFPAFHDVVLRYKIPFDYFYELIDGMEMDLTITRYSTFDDLYKYCYKAASVVGLVSIHVFGFENEEAIKYAEYCGVAFQLTNIIRDIPEDFGRGRIYLPQEDLEQFGCSESDLGTKEVSPKLKQLLEYEVKRADEYYSKSLPLVPLIHKTSRPCLIAMIKIYRELLTEIKDNNYNVFSERVRLPVWRKLVIGGQAWLESYKPA